MENILKEFNKAIYLRNIERIKEMLAKNPELITALDSDFSTPLHNAVFMNDYDTVDVIEFLIKNGADVNAKNNEGETPLHIAAFSSFPSKFNTVKLFLDSNANIDALNDNGESPIFGACIGMDLSIFQLLIESGANLNIVNNDGVALLHLLAGSDECLKMVNLMLDYGADINIQDAEGNIPLEYAIQTGSDGMAELLYEKDSNVNLLSPEAKEILYDYYHAHDLRGYTITSTDGKGNVEIKEPQKRGFTKIEISVDLKEKGLNPADLKREIATVYDGENINPAAFMQLFIKMAIHDSPVVETLKCYNVDLNQKTLVGSMIHQALWGPLTSFATQLIEGGADVNCTDNKGDTPLHLIARIAKEKKEANHQSPEIIESDESIDKKEFDNMVEEEYLVIANMLINYGAAVNALNNEGKTPLHYADKAANPRIYELLVRNGAKL